MQRAEDAMKKKQYDNALYFQNESVQKPEHRQGAGGRTGACDAGYQPDDGPENAKKKFKTQ